MLSHFSLINAPIYLPQPKVNISLYSLLPEKLVSLLPEYVVPYMIHLLAHDPDFTKPHEYEQLKDIKEYVLNYCEYVVLHENMLF